MVKQRLSVSTFALGTALLVMSSMSMAKEKVVIDLKPQTSWATTMIEGQTADEGYCAMASQYDQGLVLTMGQSVRDEYSLAIDFQDEKLNVDKPYKITLQPGPGQIRAYEMMPASESALVVRLGYDETFLKSLAQSNQLNAQIDGKAYQFAISDLAKGEAALKKCMAGLRGESTTQTASNFSAEKLENAEPLKSVENKVQKAKEPVKEIAKVPVKEIVKPVKEAVKKPAIPEVEKLDTQKVAIKEEPQVVTAPPPIVTAKKEPIIEEKPIQIARIDSQLSEPTTPMPAVEAPMVEIEKPVVAKKEEAKPVAVVTPPPVEVKKAIVPEIKAPEIKQAEVKAPEVKTPEVKVAEIKEEKRISVNPLETKKFAARPEEIAAKDKKYGSAISKISEPKQAAKTIEVKKPETLTMVDAPAMPAPKVEKADKSEFLEGKFIPDMDVNVMLQAEDPNEMPFSKSIKSKPSETKKVENFEMDEPMSTPRAPDEVLNVKDETNPQTLKAIEQIKQENDIQAANLKGQEEKLNAAKTRSAEDEVELAKVRQQLADLEKENRALYLEARKARGEIDSALIATSNQAEKKIRGYENKLDAAQADNIALSQQIEDLRRMQEEAQLQSASGNPDMQQSINRYNEAQREIQRLGLLLEQQRLAHNQEKVELENMLFDPAVTEEAQRKKLSDLEMKLAEAEKRLQSESSKVNVIDEEKQNKIQELELKLADQKKKEQEILVEKQKVKLEAEKVAAAESKLVAVAQKEQALKEKEQRLLAEQQKLSNAEATLAAAQIKEQELKAAEAKMQAESQKIAQAQDALEAARAKESQLKMAEQQLQVRAQALASAQAKSEAADAKMAEVAIKERQLKEAEQRINEQSKKLAEYSKERVAPPAPIIPALSVSPTSVPSMPRMVASAPQVPSFGSGDLQQILNNSGLSSVGRVTQQNAGRYTWNAAGLVGKAEISNNGEGITQFAKNYIAREKSNCQGDFASLPARVPGGKQGFEIACVGPNSQKSASVIFFQQNSNLIAIAHETTADNMDAAIDARDKIASQLQ